jgi:hypothetical protein
MGMARKKHSAEEIIGKLREAEVLLAQGKKVPDVCRQLGISEVRQEGSVNTMLKVYCEHGAITPKLRARQASGEIQLIYFPYDPGSKSKHLKPTAQPSLAQWRDMNIPWDELGNLRFGDFVGSAHLSKITSILGTSNRRDALHVDSAFKSLCKIFITCDNDILSKRGELQTLLDMRFFPP